MRIGIEQLHKVYSDGEVNVDPIEFEKWLNRRPPLIPHLLWYIKDKTYPIVEFEGDLEILEIETSDRKVYGYEELFEEVERIQKNRTME